MKCKCMAILVSIVMLSGCATALITAVGGKDQALMAQSRFGDAAKYLEQKITNPDQATTMDIFTLCHAYSKTKQYDKLTEYIALLEERVNHGHRLHIMMGQALMDFSPYPWLFKAQAHIEFGDYESAIKEANHAYQYLFAPLPGVLLGRSKFGTAKYTYDYDNAKGQLLAVAGIAHALNGAPEKARRYASMLERLMQSGYRPSAEHHYILTKIYMALKDYKSAQKAIELADKATLKGRVAAMLMGEFLLGNSIFKYVDLPNRFIINKIFFETGDIATAKKGYDALLAVPQTRENQEIYWMLLFDRGRIAEKENKAHDAVAFYKKAVDVIEAQRSTIHTETNKIGFVQDKQAVYGCLVNLLVDLKQYADAFEYTERAKSRALVDMLASRRHLPILSSESNTRQMLIEKLRSAEDATRLQDEAIELESAEKKRAILVKLKREIQQTDPHLASIVTVTADRLSAVQQLLPAEETLLEYFIYNNVLFAFVLTKDKIGVVKMPAEGLKERIELFRKVIMDVGSDHFITVGKAIYTQIFLPVEPILSTANLTIVPHGALHYLPFQALYGNTGFLIDQYKMRMLPSAGVMRFLKNKQSPHSHDLLAFGNPDLNDPAYALPGAEQEVLSIGEGMKKTTRLIRKKATETALKRLGAEFRFIHFATHGRFDHEKPLTSGLLMAADKENDGVLTTAELYDLKLPVELVTLSACETGLGKIAGGDDVIGLTRGFLYAGARAIVSSLWKVDDQATSFLMQQFYKSLKECDKRCALRTAQLKVKDSYNAHPFYWAAFQITGSGEFGNEGN